MVLDAEIFFFLSLSSLCGSWTAWSEESLQNILHLLILHKIELSCLHYGQHRESWVVIEKLFFQGPGEIVWHLPDSLFFTKWSRAHYSAPDCELLEPYEFITDQSILGRVWHSCPMLKNYLSNSHWLGAKLYGWAFHLNCSCILMKASSLFCLAISLPNCWHWLSCSGVGSWQKCCRSSSGINTGCHLLLQIWRSGECLILISRTRCCRQTSRVLHAVPRPMWSSWCMAACISNKCRG